MKAILPIGTMLESLIDRADCVNFYVMQSKEEDQEIYEVAKAILLRQAAKDHHLDVVEIIGDEQPAILLLSEFFDYHLVIIVEENVV